MARRNQKTNIWRQVDECGEMDAPGVHQLGGEDLELDGVVVYDQQQLEQGMMNRMDQVFNERQRTLEVKRASRELKRVEADIREVTFSVKQAERTIEMVSSGNSDKETRKRLEAVKRQKENKEKQLKTLQAKLRRLQKVAGIIPDGVSNSDDVPVEEVEKAASSSASWALTGKGEEERERLIKLGHMTPFGSMVVEEEEKEKAPKKKKVFLDGGFSDFLTSQEKPSTKVVKVKPKKLKKPLNTSFKIPKKKKLKGLKAWIEDNDKDIESGPLTPNQGEIEVAVSEDHVLNVELPENDGFAKRQRSGSDDEYLPDDDDVCKAEQDDRDDEELMKESTSFERKRKKVPKYDPETGLPIFDYDDETMAPTKRTKLKDSSPRTIDDGKLANYKKRMEKYRKQLAVEAAEGIEAPEDKCIANDYKVPGRIWSRLYKYQRTGVRWLCELHSQKVGGILGDEMGLGKTVQIISFLATIHQSKIRCRSVPGYAYEGLGPVLIITPTTVMHQWVREFHTWYPPMRVAILHDSGTYDSSMAQLVDNITTSNGVLITSYERARINIDMLLDQGWHYVILDEGHKIRNPEAAVTVAIKLFRTPHRLILSGSPVQNNLKELWSLFDFIFPGKLGTLPAFMEQFSVPIVQGGYSNASEIQVHTAYKCACKLRDTISPYLLRRMKRDVQLSLDLPSKNEQVLFCRLTDAQIEVYKRYLDSDQVHSILTREMKVFAGLIQLRKICNHPDLYTGGPKIMVGEATPSPHDKRSFGFYKRSGKMLVISSLLKIWKKQGHKVLLFTQSKAMLDILEIFVSSRGYKYLTLHGGTSVQSRQPLIQQFNEDPSLFVFILTTRVGGLGVNLTGANRVVIYDPDWNPSTDSQAQERAWRIGQRRDVTIYRLLTSGTIEEKIYHRQIFKQFLTNRILKDPWQRRFFKSNDLHELFILKDYGHEEADSSKDGLGKCRTETAAIFAGTGSEVKPNEKGKNKSSRRKSEKDMQIVEESSGSIATQSKNKTVQSSTRNSVTQESINEIDSVNQKSVEVKSQTTSSDNILNSKETEITKKNEASLKGLEATSSPSDDAKTCNDATTSNNTSSSLKLSLLRAKEKFEKAKLAEEAKYVKKKKKSKRKPVVDGEVVKNLASVEDYKPNKSSAEEIEEKSQKATDDYVLHRLFKRAGVHSALQHNTIMDSAHPDYALVEVEAERVAKESIRNLRLSRRQYKYPTGRQPGTNSKPRFGKSGSSKIGNKDDSAIVKAEKVKDNVFKASHLKDDTKEDSVSDDEDRSSKSDSPTPLSASQLLAMMRRRNHEEIHKQEEEDAAQEEEQNDIFGYSLSQLSDSATVAVNPTEHDELLEDLRAFIAFGCRIDGQARTSEIIEHFGDKIQPSHSAIFKSILKELCTSQHSPDFSENVWYLKPEFR